MIFSHTASALAPVTMLVAVIAPGLTSGFISGAPVPTTFLHRLDRDDRVEARAGGVDADPLFDRLEPLFLDDLGHREHLGDRLDRDFGLEVAGGVDLAVGGDQRDAEQIRVDLGERRNVVGVLAFLEVLVLVEGGVDDRLRIAGLRARDGITPTREKPTAAISATRCLSRYHCDPSLASDLDAEVVLDENWSRTSSDGSRREKFSRRPH